MLRRGVIIRCHFFLSGMVEEKDRVAPQSRQVPATDGPSGVSRIQWWVQVITVLLGYAP